ncbi:unnamed protein product [Gordionus sp. m RMFG-2023]|uniref:nucleolin-like n=1 Tax=Gordionus sp. m RMFG-2023 TaxID=3053472 RepID=UPI0030E51E5D
MKTPKSLNKSNQNFENRGFNQTPKARNMKSKTPNSLPQKKSKIFANKQNNSPNNKLQKNGPSPKKSILKNGSSQKKSIKKNISIHNGNKSKNTPKKYNNKRLKEDEDSDVDSIIDREAEEMESEEIDSDFHDLDDLASDYEKDIKIKKTKSKNLSKKGQQPLKIVNKGSDKDDVIPKKQVVKKRKPNENKKTIEIEKKIAIKENENKTTEIEKKDTTKDDEMNEKITKEKNKNIKTSPAKDIETSPLPEDVLAMVMERIVEKNKRTLFVKAADILDHVATDDFMKLHPDITHVQFNKRQKRAFIEFEDEATCVKAVKSLKNKKLGTKDVTFDYCGDKSERKVPLDKPYLSRPYDPKTLYVTGFGKDATKEILKRLFTSSSSINVLKFDKGKGSFKFAFVTYPNPEEAENAFRECHGKIVSGRPVYVTYALTKPKIERQPEKSGELTSKKQNPETGNKKKTEKPTNKNAVPKNKKAIKKLEKKPELDDEDADSTNDSEEMEDFDDDEAVDKSDDDLDEDDFDDEEE